MWGLIPASGRSSGGGHGNPLLYSCLANLVGRGAWWATVHRVAKNRTQLKRLSMHAYISCYSDDYLELRVLVHSRVTLHLPWRPEGDGKNRSFYLMPLCLPSVHKTRQHLFLQQKVRTLPEVNPYIRESNMSYFISPLSCTKVGSWWPSPSRPCASDASQAVL